MGTMFDTAVIGGGVAGFAAALAAADNGARSVCIMEGGQRVCRKLSASGNGQGNIANAFVSRQNYHGSFADGAWRIFETVGYEGVLDFYRSINIACIQTESGRIYPRSMQASSVTDRVRAAAEARKIKVFTDSTVKRLSAIPGGGIGIFCGGNSPDFAARTVVLACGGAASPHLAAGTGYGLLTDIGHSLSKLMPSLVRLTTEQRFSVEAGIRTDALATLYVDGLPQAELRGDVQFTQYGISGSAVFGLSGRAVRAVEEGRKVQIALDFAPEESADEVARTLFSFAKSSSGIPDTLKDIDGLYALKYGAAYTSADKHSKKTAHKKSDGATLAAANQNKADCTEHKKSSGNDLAMSADAYELLPVTYIAKQLIPGIVQRADICAYDSADTAAKKLAVQIKHFIVTVTGSLGLKQAQVTAGGITPQGFDHNLMSIKLPGLYACGEMLDVDGDCGGYNIMMAVACGMHCGRHAAMMAKQR